MVIAKVTVSGVIARATYKSKIPQGIVGATVEFDYADPMWAGLKKTVIFWSSAVKDILDVGESVVVPPEVVAKAGCRLRVGIYGVDLYGNTIIPTLWADLGPVEGSADPSLDPSAKDELPVWAQLQAQIGDLSGLQTETKASLVAAINEMITEFDEYDKAQVQRITDLLHEALREAQQSGAFDGPPGPAGPAGADGKDGEPGPAGANGAPGKDGKDGAPGKDGSIGADGFSPSVTVTQTESGAIITVTDKDGTTTATIESGAPGKDGEAGPAGPAGPAGADGKDGQDGADGAPGADGKTPVKGEDYFTDADKKEIVDAVLEELPETSVATVVDLSAYESDGKIVETYADGSVVTTVMEFDSNGKPTKITDSNGNVTMLTW